MKKSILLLAVLFTCSIWADEYIPPQFDEMPVMEEDSMPVTNAFQNIENEMIPQESPEMTQWQDQSSELTDNSEYVD